MQIPDIPGLTPEHLRESSNLAHTVEGALLLTAAAIAGAQAMGKLRGGRLEHLWPLLLFAAGGFLLVYLPLHHGVQAVPEILRYAIVDAQQRQHFLLAILAVVGGLGAYGTQRRAARERKRYWSALVFPVAVAAIGAVFLLHPQHGSSEAVSRARALHLVIGTLFIGTGVGHSLSVLRPESRALGAFWPAMLAATGVALMVYREPAGAYEPGAHGPAQHGVSGATAEPDPAQIDTTSNRGRAIDTVSATSAQWTVDAARDAVQLGARRLVTVSGTVRQPFLTQSGALLTLDGATVQIFIYGDASARGRDTDRLDLTRVAPPEMMVTWRDPPTLVTNNNLAAIILTRDIALRHRLRDALSLRQDTSQR